MTFLTTWERQNLPRKEARELNAIRRRRQDEIAQEADAEGLMAKRGYRRVGPRGKALSA